MKTWFIGGLCCHATKRTKIKDIGFNTLQVVEKCYRGIYLVFVGVIIFAGGIRIRNLDLLFDTQYGNRNPIIQNAITQDSLWPMRRYIHFVDNDRSKAKGQPGYDPSQQVASILKVIQRKHSLCWILGDPAVINESMVKYKGKFISFVQYMPAKPIKHGIKIWCMCCAYTGLLVVFEVYTGAEAVSPELLKQLQTDSYTLQV